MAMIPYMDEVSRNHALRARAAALPGVGMHSVDSFFPPIEKQGVPNANTSMAVLENNALRQPGGKAMVEPSQNQAIHFDTHMKDAMSHLKEQDKPENVLVHLHQVGPHMAQHLQLLGGDPTRKQQVKQMQQQLDALGKQTDQLQQQVEESMQAGGQNGNGAAPVGDEAAMGMGADLVPKMAKVQGDLQLKAQKMGMDHDLKVRKQDFNEQIADKKTAFGIQRDTQKTAGEAQKAQASMDLQDQQVTHGMTLEQLKTRQALAIERAKATQGMAVERTKTHHSISLAERKARHDAALRARQANQKAREKPKSE